MVIDDKFNLNDYANEQRKYIIERYEKHINDTGKHETLSHYIEHFYIKLGYASKFHKQYMEKVSPRAPLPN